MVFGLFDKMIYKFIDDKGTFTVNNPHQHNLYFPLTNKSGTLLSSISPNLAGDIKRDNESFLTPPASIEDLKNNFSCRRDFFIKTALFKSSKSRKKLTEITRLSYPNDDTLEGGLLYHKIKKNTKLFNIEILNFIPYNLAAEIMWVKIKNRTNSRLRITPTSFIPLYGRGERNVRDHRQVTSLLNRIYLKKWGVLLKPTMVFDERGHRENKTIYFVLGYEGEGIPPVGQFPTLEHFCGKGSLIYPEAIEENLSPIIRKQAEHDGKESCAALRFRKRILNRDEEVNYLLIMGIAESKEEIDSAFQKLKSLQKIRLALDETKKYWLAYLEKIKINFHKRDFDNWLLWVKLQPKLRELFGCSYLPHFDYGKGGRGWRDLWQDNLALVYSDEKEIKKSLIKSFAGVRIDGSNATIITKDNKFISDRNRLSRVWMDHGIWPYLTLKLYINKTADLGTLLKETTYFRDYQLKRAKEIDYLFSQKDYLLRSKDNKIYEGSILEHILIPHLVQFFNVGSHNIIRLENADWNDGLDMAPQKGESVTFSFMYARNLEDICFLLEGLKEKTNYVYILEELTLLLDRLNQPLDYTNDKAKQRRLDEYLEKTKAITGKKIKITIDELIYDLKDKAKHLFRHLKKEWLREGFFNGYYDEAGRRSNGKIKAKTQMMLAPQVFSIMSGAATTRQIKKIWSSINRYLKDKTLGGFHLNTNFGSLYPALGRAFGFSYGDKENGAFFSHMSVMLAYALYKRGFIKEGFEVISSIYKMATSASAQIYPMIPEYFNNQGKGLYFYLTGSASWYIYTLLEEVLGIKFSLGSIIIEPKLLPSNFFNHCIKVQFPLREKMIVVSFLKQGEKYKPFKIKKIFLEKRGIPIRNNHWIIKKREIKKLKQKHITITVYLH